MRHRLRTLLIVLASGPMVLAASWRWHEARGESAVKAVMQRFKIPCKPQDIRAMFRFTIRDVLWLMAVAALGVMCWSDRTALRQSSLEKADAEQKAKFLLAVLQQDGYEIDAPQGIKGPISVPSHYEVLAARQEGHILEPKQNRP